MIELFEQDGYSEDTGQPELPTDWVALLKARGSHTRSVIRNGHPECCYRMEYAGGSVRFQTSYFVGVDWVVPNKLPVYVQPKQNNESVEIDYMRMLLEALQEPENLAYLDGLVSIDFHKPYIAVTQQQDWLSPFLIAQFLQVVKRIVQKGLKKTYYPVSENRNARVKGKIFVGKNIRENTVRGRYTHIVCTYREFGVDGEENRILKQAYRFASRAVQQYRGGIDIRPLLRLVDYIRPAFEKVSDEVDIRKLKAFKSNPLFKEYDQAVRLALLLLRRYSYTMARIGQQRILTPPFWIDMSKLFELYVFKKLRAAFPSGQVRYHVKAHYRELDFILNSPGNGLRFVIDAKYKPAYHAHTVSIDDIRQVCGYARLEKVYAELSVADESRNIDCLVIYSHPDCDESFGPEHFVYRPANDARKIRKQNGYVGFYKLGIRLPQRE